MAENEGQSQQGEEDEEAVDEGRARGFRWYLDSIRGLASAIEQQLEDRTDDESSESEDEDDYRGQMDFFDENVSSEEDEDSIDDPSVEVTSFDGSLPYHHRYLGDIEGLPGACMRGDIGEPDEVIILPLLPLNGVVLFPGQTIPLRVYGYYQQGLIDRLLSHIKSSNGNASIKSRVFGVLNGKPEMVNEKKMVKVIGTIAEIGL